MAPLSLASFVGGGGAAGAAPVTSSASARSGELTSPFDASHWTVATSGSSAMGQRPAGSSSEMALYIGAGLVALVAIVMAVKK
jgi:hypothetical protein